MVIILLQSEEMHMLLVLGGIILQSEEVQWDHRLFQDVIMLRLDYVQQMHLLLVVIILHWVKMHLVLLPITVTISQ